MEPTQQNGQTPVNGDPQENTGVQQRRPYQTRDPRDNRGPIRGPRPPHVSTPNRGFRPATRGNYADRTGAPSRPNSSTGEKPTQRKPRESFGRRNPTPMRLRRDDDLTTLIPESGENIRIIPLGGVEEIGRNMTAIEFMGDIIVIDAGFQFTDDDTPGIDYILPNTKYLEERKDRIRALFITHGHLDHIGGLPFIIDRIGYPTIYTRKFGAIMVQKRQEEFPHLQPLDIKIIEGNETITCGSLKIKTFPISHTIPDSMGLIIETPYGNIVFIEDVRVDNIKGVPTQEEEKQYEQFKGMNVLLLTMDSTSIEKPGFSLSENVVAENIDRFIKDTSGRLVIATFASQVERIIAIIKAAEKYGKKMVIEGRSMKTNVEIIKLLKLAEINNIIPIEDLENYPPDRIVMLVTGAQGEEFAALMRIATKTHKYLQLKTTDTILLSSSVIPTNHAAVVRLKDNLYRSGAKIVTYADSDIHASGHGNRDELKWIHQHIDYRFFMPVHGNHYMLCQHAELSYTLGHKKEDIIIPDNGSIIEISDKGQKIQVLKEKAPSDLVLVDGFAVGDVQEVVIRDRQILSADGFIVITVLVNTRTGRLRKSPDIISRGFVYLRESQDLINSVRTLVKNTIEDSTQNARPVDFDIVKDNIADNVARFIFQKTAKKPIVIPVILGV